MDGRAPLGLSIATGIGLFGVLFFFQTRDPMILIFAMIAGGIAYAVTTGWRPMSTVEVVKVRCRACSALNPEDAKHCMSCGRPI